MPSRDDLPGDARVVIIGAGIVGCSAAYHLTRLGWKDIVVLDQGPLFEAGGSTSHAPGMVFENNAARTTCQFAMRSVDVYRDLRLNGESLWTEVGSLEVATTPERWEELKRRNGHATSWGLETHLIGPDEIKRMVPIMRIDHLYGAIHVPHDGTVRTTRACEALARLAAPKGARFLGGTRVIGIEVRNGRVEAVLTEGGRIRCEQVLCAAGIWGPVVGRMAGVPIPLQPMQHLYAITDPLPEFQGETAWQSTPLVRHQDKSMYFRQHYQGYLLGSYRHEPVLVDAADIRRHEDDPMMPSCMPFRDDLFQAALASAQDLYPPLRSAELVEKVNGMFSFTPDAHSLIGESLDVRGFWACEAVWLTHGPGAAQAVAEWMVDGIPSLDLREEDLNRFYPHVQSPSYVRARGAQNYREIYDIIHPLQPMAKPRQLRLTPFYDREVALGSFFTETAGWERPLWYEANQPLLAAAPEFPIRSGWAARFWSPVQGVEHLAARQRVALFDATPFVKIEVTGRGALAYLQRLAANQMDHPVGKVTYTAMLNERGGIMTDLTVTRVDEDRFWVVTGGAVGMHDLAWMRSRLPADHSVRLENLTSGWCCNRNWGVDMYSEHTPYEVGIGFAVRLSKGDFIGRDALLRSQEQGITRKLSCLTFDDPTVAVMGKEPIFADGQVAGFVTSANYGYTVGQSIVYGYLPVEHAAAGTKVEIQYFGKRYPATVRKEPLFDPEMTRLKETAPSLPPSQGEGGRGVRDKETART